MAQLTWRAVIMGSLLGGVLSLTNLYVGLKAGWGFGVSITACILSYAIWTTLHRAGLARTPMTILENNCMQSTASAAGYSTGTTLISAFAAYIMINGTPLPVGLTLAWVFFLAVLGVTMAIPMKRQMVNVEQLRFPTGTASAETLRALYSKGTQGMRAARALTLAGALAGLSTFLTDGLRLISPRWEALSIGTLLTKLNAVTIGPAWMARTVMFFWDPVFIAAGAITGLRVGLSMLIGGTLCWGVFVPMLQSTGATSTFLSAGFRPNGAGPFVAKLREGADPLSQYLWSQFAPETRQALSQETLGPQTVSALVAEMDRVLQGPLLYTPERLTGVTLSGYVLGLAAAQPTGGRRMVANRLLLEEVYAAQIERSTGFKSLVQWSLWGGTACMVTSGLLVFLLQWRSSLRAFRSLGAMFLKLRGGKTRAADPMDAIEAPISWYLIGQVVALAALAWLAHRTFNMPVWLSLVAFFLSFVLALVACRVTGETDTTPLSAMGQITQLSVAAMLPRDLAASATSAMSTTLMSANIVSGAAISSADLLTDLRSGYMLGANPRKQFLAQFAGIFAGTIVTVLAFAAMVPDASKLGTDQFPAPAAQNWRAVAVAMSQGLGALGPVKTWAMAIGALVGVLLAVLPVVFPKKARLLPSAAGLGLAWTFHWYYSLLFFLGGLLAYLWEKWHEKSAREFNFPISAGVIAGGSLMGVVLVFWENGPEIWHQFFGQ